MVIGRGDRDLSSRNANATSGVRAAQTAHGSGSGCPSPIPSPWPLMASPLLAGHITHGTFASQKSCCPSSYSPQVRGGLGRYLKELVPGTTKATSAKRPFLRFERPPGQTYRLIKHEGRGR
jgi:hypothetical protein